MSRYKVIDVSKWQAYIDWSSVKRDGVEFAVLREGYRQSIDERFIDNVKGCKENGIVVMVYHFIYTDRATPEQNAQSTVKNLQKAGLDTARTMIFADLEYDTWKKNGEQCTRERCTEYTQRYLNELKRLECKRLGIYLNIDYYQNYYTDAIKQAYPLWLADYSGDADYACIMQQYTSKGKVDGITGNVDMNYLFDSAYMSDNTTEGGNTDMGVTAQDVLNVMRSWIGYSEANKKYIEILNIYNSHKPLARGYAIKPNDEWCDATVSAAAIQAGAVDLIGTEVGVEKHVDIFKAKGIWIEDGKTTPRAGDIIVYNLDDGTQPNDGYSDHIGYVESVSGGQITTIEGNMSQKVGRNNIPVGYGYIRGFARPRYTGGGGGNAVNGNKPAQSIDAVARDVIAGKYGDGEARRQALKAKGYDYDTVQARVNEILKGNKPSQDLTAVAKDVIAGEYGNGEARRQALRAKGYDPDAVQVIVNKILKGQKPTQDLTAVARAVIRGDYGDGEARRKALRAKGYDPDAVQRIVNELL